MTVTVCDACGESYKKYTNTSFGEGSGLSIISRMKDGKIKPSLKIDLCPDCMEKVWDYILNDLITKKSLRYEELCGGDVSSDEDGELGEMVASSESDV